VAAIVPAVDEGPLLRLAAGRWRRSARFADAEGCGRRQITTSLDLAVGGSAVQRRPGGLASSLRPDYALRRHRHTEHRRPNVDAAIAGPRDDDLVEECARCLVEAAVGGGGWPLGCRAGWYLVLTNRGQDEARDIRIKTQPLTEGEAWKILTGRDEDLILTPDVERLGGKHDVILFPIADALNTAGIVKCIVTWTDDRGEHTDTTTLQQKSSSEPAWNEAPSR
jgi:hypothetical protein